MITQRKNTKTLLVAVLVGCAALAQAQLSPAVTAWLQNTVSTGSYYMSGNSATITNNILVNCQKVEYTSASVYVSTKGIPAYPTGPFLDGNPSQAGNQNAIFKFPLSPAQNTGSLTGTTMGNIGVFINGVALFDYRDGVSWKNSTQTLCGGPIQPPCMGDGVWNRDAVVAEKGGFDCSKGHPAMGNYHHHQNPSAFKLDLNVISNVCNLYDAEGLYAINPAQHSPLLGFAYDGFPIYGAYAYKNTNGTGGIVRMKSGYQLRNITVRTTYADGSNVTAGPVVSSTYPLGYFKEDYEFISHPAQTEYLDEHNGRFCVTPEYPGGIYAYFCTVDSNYNSAFPYAVGPTFYGVYANRKVASVSEPTTVYQTLATGISEKEFDELNVSIFPNPATDLIALQLNGLVKNDYSIELRDITGKLIKSVQILKGSTIAYFDTQTLYEGIYIVRISSGNLSRSEKVVIRRQ
jgi:hypothetical protein